MTKVNSIETSQTLLDAVAKGEDAAWVRFVLHYQPILYNRCRQFGLSADDSNCMTQDIFIELFARIRKFSRRRRGSFRKWLTIIVRTQIIDLRRTERLKFERSVDADFAASLIPSELESAPAVKSIQMSDLIDSIRSKFSDRDWTIFYLTIGEERAPSEVADALGVSENIVYLTKSRMMKKIRAIYEKPT